MPDLPVAIAFLLLLLQLPAVAILLSRLLRGPGRRPPLEPRSPAPKDVGAISAIVPTLNEAERIAPCLEGLSHQSYEVREILVVDSHSQDGTRDRVKQAAGFDPRIRLLFDDPLPPDWVGRPWALHNGFLQSSPRSQWILGIDADVRPRPGLAASLLAVARAEGYDLITLSPQFVLESPGEVWLQPALLMTLVYRFGPAGAPGDGPERAMANGQCFFCRRDLLAEMGGYISAKGSFCDDVTLARHIAARGFRVGFLDGAKLLQVRMYEGARETWREWGRSLDLKDASAIAQTWGDVAFLVLVQGLPPIATAIFAVFVAAGLRAPSVVAALATNAALLAIRFALCGAIAPSYDLSRARGRWLFWLSPLADPLAALRLVLSASSRPKQWRGRSYG